MGKPTRQLKYVGWIEKSKYGFANHSHIFVKKTAWPFPETH